MNDGLINKIARSIALKFKMQFIIARIIKADDEEVVDSPCERENYTGWIRYGETDAKVKNASFSFDESGIVWKSGEVVGGNLAMPGIYNDFSGFFNKNAMTDNSLNKAWFRAFHASFKITVNSDKTIIHWKKGTWEGGVWTTGIWEGGEWHDGTWKFGIWRAPGINWCGGKDMKGNVHPRSDSPNNWQLSSCETSHVNNDYPGRYGFLDTVLVNPNNDNSIFNIWYQKPKQGKQHEGMIILYNNGMIVIHSLDDEKVMKGGEIDENGNDINEFNENNKNNDKNKVKGRHIQHLLPKICRYALTLDAERQLTTVDDYDTFIDALDVMLDDNGNVAKVVPLTSPRPIGFALSDKLHKIALTNSFHETFNNEQMDVIFKLDHIPLLKEVWEKKLNEIDLMSEDKLKDLYDEIYWFEQVYLFLFTDQKTYRWKKYRQTWEDFFINDTNSPFHGVFETKEDFADFAIEPNETVDNKLKEKLERKYYKWVDSKKQWKRKKLVK